MAAQNWLGSTEPFAGLAKLVAHVHRSRRLPAFAQRTFRQWFGEEAKKDNVGGERGRVVFWPDTFSNHFHPRGAMAAIGHRKGVAEVSGLRISGLPAWLLWRAYYLSQMPTLGRKVRIFVEWTWGMFFPNDITHLRFTRSQDLDPPNAATSGEGSAAPTVANA